jgi:hypothetical protein
VVFRDHSIAGEYNADLIADDQVIAERKVAGTLSDADVPQCRNDLRATASPKPKAPVPATDLFSFIRYIMVAKRLAAGTYSPFPCHVITLVYSNRFQPIQRRNPPHHRPGLIAKTIPFIPPYPASSASKKQRLQQPGIVPATPGRNVPCPPITRAHVDLNQ